MACNLTNDNYNTPTYTEVEMNMYSTYMEYCENEVDKAPIPKHIKKEMMEKRHLHKDNQSWFLYEPGPGEGYIVRFLPFKSWLTQTEREEKLTQLGL